MIKKEIIALEEHYLDYELNNLFIKDGNRNKLESKLLDVGENRIKHMDESGIDIQILSHNHPSTQNLEISKCIKISSEVNNRLYDIIQTYPNRFVQVQT